MRTHGGAEIEGFISLEQMSAERFIRIKSSIGHDAPENLLLKAGLQLQTGIIGTRVASVPGVVMNSELLGIIPSAVVESLGWSDRIQILPNPTSAEPMEVSLMSRVKQRRTRPQRCCCKQEFQITNYLLVCSATLVPDPPFSTKTRVCNSTIHTHNHKLVTRTHIIQRTIQPRTVGGRTANGILEYAKALLFFQRRCLPLQILVFRANPRIADFLPGNHLRMFRNI